jgi:ATP-dependent DNA helicase RecQ
LVYRVQRRSDLLHQISEVIERHADESGIIYCIRRKDTEELAASLSEQGHAALPYHAGLSDDKRRQNQEAFTSDRAKIIVATVAFGMGIDKSDVRYVIHAAAPKSLESYQQESGRAGRDGLEAECWLFYTGADFATWRRLQSELPPAAYEIAMQVLSGIENFSIGVTCRHRAIVRYFGQELAGENCGACDVCLAEIDEVADPLVISQKILSCVARLNEGYGGEYTAQVLVGSREERIVERGHDSLSTWGLLAEHDKKSVRGWIDQLVSQEYLVRVGEYNVLQLTDEGRLVLRGEVTPRLLKPPTKTRRESRAAAVSWQGVDRGLFDALRAFRRQQAEEHGVPPYVIFSDATLRELARVRPTTREGLLGIHGIGEKKSAAYGEQILREIKSYCDRVGIDTDVAGQHSPPQRPSAPRRDSSGSAAKRQALGMFAHGEAVEAVQRETKRARSTVVGYLLEFIEQEGVSDASPWIDAAVLKRIHATCFKLQTDRLKPIFESLGGAVAYDQIRIALACLKNDGMLTEDILSSN